MNNDIDLIICRFLSNDLTEEEQQKLKQWIEQDSNNQKILDDYKKIWQLATFSKNNQDYSFDPQEGWLDLNRALSRRDSDQSEDNEVPHTDIDDFPFDIRNFLKNEC
ncbi:MAG TPA: hypothetical protein VE868_13450 [Balneolaceae bacterium]|nr:hypothetical protein [Balneolaceae bacterium]